MTSRPMLQSMITALILAAGQSRRMGQPKMLLPWGKTTVLGQVIETVQCAGVDDILVITGGMRARVEQVAASCRVNVAHNPQFRTGEMLSSIQVGLRALIHPRSSPDSANLGRGTKGGEAAAILIVLGDQPQVQEGSVRAVVQRFIETGSRLVVPSYRMRRGHPWLAARPLWKEIQSMRAPESPRDFLNRHAQEIEYVEVDTSSILADLDTPGDYLKSRP